MKWTTIADSTREAGVSKGAVSYALNDRPRGLPGHPEPAHRRRAADRDVFDNDIRAVAGRGPHELGVGVPERLSIVGWDDSPICPLVHPPLTALSRDIATARRERGPAAAGGDSG